MCRKLDSLSIGTYLPGVVSLAAHFWVNGQRVTTPSLSLLLTSFLFWLGLGHAGWRALFAFKINSLGGRRQDRALYWWLLAEC